MGLLSRIYFNAVFGALGGLVGWMLYGIFGQKDPSSEKEVLAQLLLSGLLIGGSIGYFVVSVEAFRDRAWNRSAWSLVLRASVSTRPTRSRMVPSPGSTQMK